MNVQKTAIIKKINSMPFLGIIIYRILLDIIYANIIVPIFGYSGYIIKHSITLYIVSWAILFLFIPIIIKDNNDQRQPSCLIILIIALVAFVPFTTMIGYGFFSWYYIMCNTI